MVEKLENTMDRRTANKEWRDVTRGAPEGVPTGRTVHKFAQGVEARAIAGCDARHAAELARLRIDAGRLRVAATQASFCLRTLAPDDADAQMTVRMLHEALGGA